MRYLITGGTGLIGSSFISHLSATDDEVIILSRQILPDRNNCRFIQDLRMLDDNTIIDYMINLAGKPIDCLWTRRNKEKLIRSRVEITQAVVTLIQRLKVKPQCLISASAIGFYGDCNNEKLTESSAPKPAFTHTLCHQWEDTAMKATEVGVRVCLIRLGAVLSDTGGLIKKIHFPFKLGLGGKMGTGKQWFSWIHIEDVCLGIQFLINNNACAGAYNLVAPTVISNERFTASLGKCLHRPTLFHLPHSLIKLIGGEMADYLLLRGNEILPEKLIKAGYTFKYPTIEKALADIYQTT